MSEHYVCKSQECQHWDCDFCSKATDRHPVRIQNGQCCCYAPSKRKNQKQED